jgi:sulfur carrier protein
MLRLNTSDGTVPQFFLNGSAKALSPLTVLALLQQEKLADQRVAVEINGEIVSRSQHGERTIQADDRVEIVYAIGGG